MFGRKKSDKKISVKKFGQENFLVKNIFPKMFPVQKDSL